MKHSTVQQIVSKYNKAESHPRVDAKITRNVTFLKNKGKNILASVHRNNGPLKLWSLFGEALCLVSSFTLVCSFVYHCRRFHLLEQPW